MPRISPAADSGVVLPGVYAYLRDRERERIARPDARLFLRAGVDWAKVKAAHRPRTTAQLARLEAGLPVVVARSVLGGNSFPVDRSVWPFNDHDVRFLEVCCNDTIRPAPSPVVAAVSRP